MFLYYRTVGRNIYSTTNRQSWLLQKKKERNTHKNIWTVLTPLPVLTKNLHETHTQASKRFRTFFIRCVAVGGILSFWDILIPEGQYCYCSMGWRGFRFFSSLPMKWGFVWFLLRELVFVLLPNRLNRFKF